MFLPLRQANSAVPEQTVEQVHRNQCKVMSLLLNRTYKISDVQEQLKWYNAFNRKSKPSKLQIMIIFNLEL